MVTSVFIVVVVTSVTTAEEVATDSCVVAFDTGVPIVLLLTTELVLGSQEQHLHENYIVLQLIYVVYIYSLYYYNLDLQIFLEYNISF